MADSDDSKKYALINVGDWSKPANTLVDKISDAIGGIAKPWQIKRVAEAETEAEKIRATGQIEITALHRRAARRFLMEEAKRQHNIESIISRALPDVSDEAKPQQVEDDWIANFFDKCRLISDEEMQRLWAKVLAGEANGAGKFSKRTVNLLASLDKNDAMSFSTLCSFCISVDGVAAGGLSPLIYNLLDEIYAENGIFFMTCSHLESIGLIHFDNLQGYVRQSLPQRISVQYFDQKLLVDLSPVPATVTNNTLRVGKVLFTRVGEELAPICDVQPRTGFIDYLKLVWSRFGYRTELPGG
jgi:hypothetical protein